MNPPCTVEGCGRRAKTGIDYCETHVRACSCGARISRTASRCSACWHEERRTIMREGRYTKTGERKHIGTDSVSQIEWLINRYRDARDRDFFADLADVRIPALETQLAALASVSN